MAAKQKPLNLTKIHPKIIDWANTPVISGLKPLTWMQHLLNKGLKPPHKGPAIAQAKREIEASSKNWIFLGSINSISIKDDLAQLRANRIRTFHQFVLRYEIKVLDLAPPLPVSLDEVKNLFSHMPIFNFNDREPDFNDLEPGAHCIDVIKLTEALGIKVKDLTIEDLHALHTIICHRAAVAGAKIDKGFSPRIPVTTLQRLKPATPEDLPSEDFL